mgnify:FL=1
MPKNLPTPIDSNKFSKIISQNNEILEYARTQPKIDINNIEELISRTDAYLHFCADRSLNPNMKGLANFCGYSERHFNELRHQGTAAGEYIDLIRDRMKDNLEQAALSNAVNNISAMFLLKATHDYVEQSKLVVEPGAGLLGTPKSYEEISQIVDDNII